MIKKAYIVIGMKRSGHHAIAHWLAYNRKPAIHFNDCTKGYGEGLLIPNPNQGEKGKAVPFGKGKPVTYVYNIEDFNIDNIAKYDMLNLKLFEEFISVDWILVARDPYNWLASSLKMGGGASKNISKRISIYKRHLSLFQDYSILPTINRLSYNEWVNSGSYRSEYADRFNLLSCDGGVDFVSKRGGGSSFDRVKYDGKALSMKLMERWKEFKDDPEYVRLIDQELCRIGSDVFKFKIGLK